MQRSLREAGGSNLAMSLADKLSWYLKCRNAVDPRELHSLSFKLGCLGSTFFCNDLLHAYSLLSMSTDARKVFDEIPQRNVTTWSTMISCYTRTGGLSHAVALLKELLHGNIQGYDSEIVLFPHVSHLGSVIAGCACAGNLMVGQQMHCAALKLGVENDTFIASTLINMYGKCGKVSESWRVFHLTPCGDAVTWTSAITCLANSGETEGALTVFKDMIYNQIWPVSVTFASLVKIFDEPGRLCQAKQVHGCMVKLGIEINGLLGSALIAMYGKCGGLDEAVRISARVKMDVVSWTSFLVACMQNGYNVDAINIFRDMVGKKVVIDSFVIASVIGACSCLRELRGGKEMHCYVLRYGFSTDVSVCNALITLYGRCNQIANAERLFELMRNRDVISWTALLTCYGQNGRGEAAIFLFQEMLRNGISPPVYCISGAIRACSLLAASLSISEQIHCRTVKAGIDGNLSVENSLIATYAKCGQIDLALRVFNSMNTRDLVSWNAMITGFSQHGHEGEALELFDKMQKKGIQPDDYTFVGVLVSCSRLGLVAQGCHYFRTIREYNLEPKLEHYACMIDLFGRAGRLYDALAIINNMPFQPDQLIWDALLASCKIHENVELVKFVAYKIMQMRPEDPSPYITLSSMYASKSMWERKAFVQAIMKAGGVRKDPGRSWIQGQYSLDDSIYLQMGRA